MQQYIQDYIDESNVYSIFKNNEIKRQLNNNFNDNSISSCILWDSIKQICLSNAEYNLLVYIILKFCYPRLDVLVTKNIKHLIKSPFSINVFTGYICVPLPLHLRKLFYALKPPSIFELKQQYLRYNDIVKTNVFIFLKYYEDYITKLSYYNNSKLVQQQMQRYEHYQNSKNNSHQQVLNLLISNNLTDISVDLDSVLHDIYLVMEETMDDTEKANNEININSEAAKMMDIELLEDANNRINETFIKTQVLELPNLFIYVKLPFYCSLNIDDILTICISRIKLLLYIQSLHLEVQCEDISENLLK